MIPENENKTKKQTHNHNTPLCSCPPSIRSFAKNCLFCVLLGKLRRQQSPVFYDLSFQVSLTWFYKPNLFCISPKETVKFDSPFYHWVLKYVLLNFRFGVEEWKEACWISLYSILSFESFQISWFLGIKVHYQVFLTLQKTCSTFPLRKGLICLLIAHVLLIPTLYIIKQTPKKFKWLGKKHITYQWQPGIKTKAPYFLACLFLHLRLDIWSVYVSFKNILIHIWMNM